MGKYFGNLDNSNLIKGEEDALVQEGLGVSRMPGTGRTLSNDDYHYLLVCFSSNRAYHHLAPLQLVVRSRLQLIATWSLNTR